MIPAGAPSSPRRLSSLGLFAHCQIEGRVSQETVGAISEEGLFLQTKEALALGTRVRLVMGLPFVDGQRVCSLSGRVSEIERDPQTQAVRGVALRFDSETDASDRALLRGFLFLWSG